MASVAELIVRIKAQVGDLEKDLSSAKKKMESFGKDMTAAGKTLTVGVTAPIVGVGVAALKSSIDYESAFAGVKKTVDATEEELAALSDGIRDMAKEIPAAAAEIAGVAEAAGQLGIETDNILGFTRTMVDLGESTNLSADQAATALARLANITQMPQTEFDKLGSTIVALGNNLATTESEIVEMGLRLAGAGKQVGMTEAQILGFAGALSSVGIEAQAGGSAFSKVMVQMQLAVEKGGKSLDEFAAVAGMSGQGFQKAFRDDAARAIIDFIGGLGTAEERGMSAIKVLDDMGITEVRLRDALLRAAGAGDLFSESIAIGTQAWAENVALTTEAAQRYETTESQLEILKNKLTDARIELGDKLGPILKDTIIPAAERFIDVVGKVIDWFGQLSPEMQTVILVALALAAALGPVLMVIGSIASGIATLMPIITAIGGAIAAIGAPVILVAGLIIAAIVLIAKNWEDIVELLKIGWEWISDVFIKGWEAVSEFFGNLWEGIKNIFSSTWEWIKDLFLRFHPIGLVISHWDTISDFFVNLWAKVKDGFKQGWDGIVNAIRGPVNVILGFANGIIAGFERMLNAVGDAINSIPKFKIPDWVPLIGGGEFGLPNVPTAKLPRIPLMDTGGIVKGPGLFQVGPGVVEVVRRYDPAQGGGRLEVFGTIRHEGISDRGQLIDSIDVVMEQITSRLLNMARAY